MPAKCFMETEWAWHRVCQLGGRCALPFQSHSRCTCCITLLGPTLMSGGIRVGWMKACFHSTVSGVSKQQVFGGGLFGKIQIIPRIFRSSPWCASLPEITLAICPVLYDDTTIFPVNLSQNHSYQRFLFFFHPDHFYCPIHSIFHSYKFCFHTTLLNSLNCKAASFPN